MHSELRQSGLTPEALLSGKGEHEAVTDVTVLQEYRQRTVDLFDRWMRAADSLERELSAACLSGDQVAMQTLLTPTNTWRTICRFSLEKILIAGEQLSKNLHASDTEARLFRTALSSWMHDWKGAAGISNMYGELVDYQHQSASGAEYQDDLVKYAHVSLDSLQTALRNSGILKSLLERGVATGRLDAMVNDARQHIDQIRHEPMAELVQRAAGSFPELQVTVVGTERNQIRTDRALLASVLANILRNAMEAGATRVQVQIESPTQKPLMVHVADNGSGVSHSRASDPVRLAEINAKLDAAARFEAPEAVSENTAKPVSEGLGMINAASIISLYHRGSIQLHERFDFGQFAGIHTTITLRDLNAQFALQRFLDR